MMRISLSSLAIRNLVSAVLHNPNQAHDDKQAHDQTNQTSIYTAVSSPHP
jgi:hypothetical protein